MIEHVAVPVSDYEAARAFYVAALAPLGYEMTQEYPPDAAGFKEGGHTSFWISKKSQVVPIHVAFLANSREEIAAFYRAALGAGGKDNGEPGMRDGYGYAAFVHDPDGNNIEAVLFEGDG